MQLLVTLVFIIAGTIWAGFLLAALFGKLFLSLFPARRVSKKWPANGVEAEAIILKMERTGLYINKLPQIRLQMQVRPDKGRNFLIDIDTVTPPAVKAGGVVRVKYNPRNYKELLLVNVA
ncbi:MAG TPA: hypothetical protein VGO58_11220 [Chitinophagaceae bacterium]|nr:hypothetical protein [Chitinophagaceae bacterium]